jgi:16S rRNA (guanine966-N2)-methyltransferase
MLIIRVIAGQAGGMKLKTPKGMNTRPTVDRVKESLFNILHPYLNESRVLDLFSGTGALAIEALSRGAAFAVLVDADRGCCEVIRENLAHTRLAENAEVYCRKAGAAVLELGRKGVQFDIVFMDPPYRKNFVQETLQLLADNDIIVDGGMVIAEHHREEPVPESLGRLVKTRTQAYGETCISFLVCETGGEVSAEA